MMRNRGRATPPADPSIRTTIPPADVSRVARARDTLGSLWIAHLGPPFDELPHDRICRVLYLVHCPDGAHASVVEHGDPGSDAIRAAHVVRDDDARDAEAVSHPDHEFVDDGAGH